jgi:hypothetical protein
MPNRKTSAHDNVCDDNGQREGTIVQISLMLKGGLFLLPLAEADEERSIPSETGDTR